MPDTTSSSAVPFEALLGALNLSSEGIIIYEPVSDANAVIYDMRIAMLNNAAERIFGVPRNVAVGARLSAFWPMDKEAEGWQKGIEVLHSGRPQQYEWSTESFGNTRHFEVLLQVYDSYWLAASYNDVTDRRMHALALERQQGQLNVLLQEVPLGITVFEAVRDVAGELQDLRLTRRNEQALHLSRIPAGKYQPGALLSELMPPELLKENFGLMLDVVRSGKSMIHELYQPHLNRWISSRVMKHGDGLLNTIQDVTDNKRHGEETRQQAELLEGILQASPHAILVFEAVRDSAAGIEDFRIIRFNERAVAATALSADALSGTTLFTCMPSVRGRLPQYRSVIESRNAETYEFFNEKLGMWRRITNTPLGDGFVMTMEDITEQKRISRQIEEGARLLNAVLDSSPIAIAAYRSVRNAEGLITDFSPIIANRLALQTAGYPAEAFMAESLLERSAEAGKDFSSLVQVVEKRQPKHYEHEVPSSGRWVRATTTPFGDGFIATAQDVTDQKAQSRIIEDQAALFNGVLASLQNGLTIYRIIRDDAGKLQDLEYLQVADSVLRDTGKRREDMLGQRLRTIYPGIENTDYWAAYNKVTETGKPVSFETHFTLPGYDNYLLNWVTPHGNDKLVNVYYIINDLKHAQRELEHTVQVLRRSNEDLEQFASIASHDLQEPLRKVQSFGAMLESRFGDALGESGRDIVGRMTGAASRMRNLVTGLLAFARLSGDENLPLAAVDLNGMLGEIISDLDQTAESAGGTIKVVNRLPFVQGIESQLRHLFQNLLTNALKFRKPDTAPVVSVSSGPLQPGDAQRLSPLADSGHYLRIEVSDNGIGFEAEYAEKIFGLFERLHGMSEYQGTGLGLSICRRVAERHEGAIWAEGRPGEGATFIVLLQKGL